MVSGWAGGCSAEKVCISETVRCRNLILVDTLVQGGGGWGGGGGGGCNVTV